MPADFTHLHLHSLYSLLDGAIRLKDLMKACSDKGMKSVAVTDHGNMFGTVNFYQEAKKHGVKPIIGFEAYVAGPKGRLDRSERVGHHLVLLAENEIGYRNLRYLSSKAFQEGFYYDPRIDKELLKKHSEGLFGLTACLAGEVPRALRRGDNDGAKKSALELKDLFAPDHFFLEIQSNKLPEQIKVNQSLMQLARDIEVPLAATADSHYVQRGDAQAHEVLMAIASGKTFDDPKRLRHETEELYIKSPDEMWDYFKTDAPEAVSNTWRIAQACNVELNLKDKFLPKYDVPEGYDRDTYIIERARVGLERRLKELPYRDRINPDIYFERLERELGVIIKMGFSGYFLIVQDFINWAKGKGIPVGPGRGSGAGSLVAYALRITDLDPLPYNLLFERFLNPERVSMPDFDVDFCQERRGEVIHYVTDKYGKDNVAQIVTYGALSAKSAIKDVARVMGLPFNEVNEITRNIPALIDGHPPTIEKALAAEPKLRAAMEEKPVYKKVIDTAKALEGLHRSTGMHAAGIVIGEQPLWEYVPLCRGQNGELVTQFAKDEVELAGLVKFDFLGLKTLTVIQQATELANRSRRALGEPPIDITRIPLDDKPSYDLMGRGETGGVFQMESSGFTEMVKKLKPSVFEDVIAAGALYRPGPLDAGMVDVFIDRKHGRQKVVYQHPLLEPILKDTYGVIVYQEQVMQIAQVLAGYSLGRADLLRRAMGKKKAEVMAMERSGFLEGAMKNGVAEALANEIFDLMEKFAEYGFNKSHSAAYGLITYQTAYLKCHYPVEFMAALLTSEKEDTDKVVGHISEARGTGIAVLSPDVNESDLQFGVSEAAGKGKKKSIRFGLGAIKGVGENSIEAIVAARTHGPFKGQFDFCARVDQKKLNAKVLEALVNAGAFDFTGQPRAALFESIPSALEAGASTQRDRASGQSSLFGLLAGGKKGGAEPAAVEAYIKRDEWGERERLAREKAALGFYITGHPLSRYAGEIARYSTHTSATLAGARNFEKVSMAGVVQGYRTRPTKTGKMMAFFTLEDLVGARNCLCYDDAVQRFGALLQGDDPVLIAGQVRIIDRMGAPGGGEEAESEAAPERELKVDEVTRLADVRSAKATRVDVRATSAELSPEKLARLQGLLTQYPGNCAVTLAIAVDGQGEAKLKLPQNVAPSDDLLAGIDRLLGRKAATVR